MCLALGAFIDLLLGQTAVDGLLFGAWSMALRCCQRENHFFPKCFLCSLGLLKSFAGHINQLSAYLCLRHLNSCLKALTLISGHADSCFFLLHSFEVHDEILLKYHILHVTVMVN